MRDWRLYLPVVARVLEADLAILQPARAGKATITIERVEQGWRLKPIHATIPHRQREELEKLLALVLHPHKWRFILEQEINTSPNQPSQVRPPGPSTQQPPTPPGGPADKRGWG